MPKRLIKFNLDFAKKDILSKFEIKQFDNAIIEISPFLDNLSYTVSESTNIKLYVCIANDVFKQETNITIQENKIIIDLDKNIIAKKGKAFAELELSDSTGVTTSTTFIFDVEDKVGEGSVVAGGTEGLIAKYQRLLKEFKQEQQLQLDDINKTLESHTEQLNNHKSQLAQIESKNIEQDSRLKDVENKNKVQDVYVRGLFNESKDGRLSIEGEGNSLKLEGSKAGLVEVKKIVGNTFVNLCTNSRNHALQKDDLKQNTMTITTSYSLTVGKQYTLVLILKDVINVNNHFLWFKAYGNDIPVTLANGIQTISFIMGDSNNSNFTLRLQLVDIQAGSKAIVDSIMIFESDLTTTPELIPTQHIEGLQSSFEENLVTQEMVNEGLESEENLGKYKVPIRLIGKNLANPKNMKIDTFIDSKGNLITDVGTTTFLNIPFSPNTSYYVSGNNVNRYNVACYNKDDKYLGLVNGVNNLINISNINIAYGHVKVGYYANNSSLVSNVQIEEGTEVTEFEDYFERTTNVYLNSPLLKGDEIVEYKGELCHYHKYEEKVFDGNDTHGLYRKPSTPSGSYSFRYDFAMGVDLSKAISTVNLQPGVTWYNDTSSTCFGYFNNQFVMTLPTNAPNDYFKKNPTTIIYPLAEPYHEVIQADKLLLECANNSTIHIDSIVPVESVLASYTGNVPSVYSMDVDIAINTEDISVTQTAVDFLLMSSMGEVMMMSFNENTKGGNQMGAYFASRIMKGALKYEDVIRKYPEFKDDIDFILRSEGYEHLIVEIQ